METKSRYGEFRNCASCKREINIAVELFLIRLDNYWHDYCFCCKYCHLPIPNCKFIVLDGDAWHKSCYKKQHQGSNINPKHQPICVICKELGKKMKFVMKGFGKKSKMQSHHVVSNEEEETREITPEENPRVENSTPPRNSEENESNIIEGNPIPSPPPSPRHSVLSTVGEPVNAPAQDPDAHCTHHASQTSSSSSSSTNPQPTFDPNSLRPDLVPIYNKIAAKHGDITKNCTLRSQIFKSTYLNNSCSILEDLQTTQLCDINEHQLQEMLELSADIEKAGFNVGWLNTHLVKLQKVLGLNKAYKALESTREQQAKTAQSLKQSIDSKEEELSKLRSQFWEARNKYDRICHEIMVIKSSLDQCPMITLVDGLM